jgi:hypothetical protein
MELCQLGDRQLLLVQVPGCAFRNNRHVGAFVQLICGIVLQRAEHCTAYQQFFVAKASGGTTLFIDTGVYTRNRCSPGPLCDKSRQPAKHAGCVPAAHCLMADLTPSLGLVHVGLFGCRYTLTSIEPVMHLMQNHWTRSNCNNWWPA